VNVTKNVGKYSVDSDLKWTGRVVRAAGRLSFQIASSVSAAVSSRVQGTTPWYPVKATAPWYPVKGSCSVVPCRQLWIGGGFVFGLAKARHCRRLQVGETHAGQTVKHMEKDHHMYDLSPEDVSFYLDGENFEEFHQK
jgi:hypothetical protein